MTSGELYLSVREFSQIARISDRKARHALARAYQGLPWRDHSLKVRRVKGRGGKSGWQYQVLLESLPIALQEEWRVIEPSADQPILEIEEYNPVGHWRYEVIESALKHPSRSSGRALAVREASKVHRTYPSGRRGYVSERTIRVWIDAYETKGMNGLLPRPRSDRGARRIFVTREWDSSVPFDDATKRKIESSLSRQIRSLWASNDMIGWQRIAHLASNELMDLTVAAGFGRGTGELRRICRLPRNVIERGREYRAVAIYDKDRKKYFDTSVPRIQRSRENLEPMTIVVADVHHCDVLMKRSDGTIHTPKLIGFLDLATNRLFAVPVFPPKGTMVRQEHVAAAYVAMVNDDCWGLPQSFYIDNGGEFNVAEFVDAAQQLNTEVRHLGGEPAVAAVVGKRLSSIVKAQPYNAQAKAIEGIFRVVEHGYLSMLDGWIGGDRMAKKTANIGREPKPFSGGEEEFTDALATAVKAYEFKPQDGALRGKSPREVFNGFVESGWKRRPVDGDALRAAFARPMPKRIRQGKFRYRNQYYTSPQLQRLSAGTKVIVRVPIASDLDRLPVMRADGRFLCMAERETSFGVFDPAGAKEARNRRRRNEVAIKDMRTDIDPINLLEIERQIALKHEAALIPDNLEPIQLGEAFEKAGREMAVTAAERRLRDEEQKRQHEKVMDDGLEKLVRSIGGSR